LAAVDVSGQLAPAQSGRAHHRVEHSYTPAWEALKVPNLARFHTNLSIAARLVDQIVCVSKAQAAWLNKPPGCPWHRGHHPSLFGQQWRGDHRPAPLCARQAAGDRRMGAAA
jgi:hypothetical protein